MINVSSVVFLGREREYVADVMRSGRLTQGPYVERFEEAFAEFCGVEHAVACSSGTAALHLALIAAGVKPGDRVAVPALTYVATANAVRYAGAEPVFVDVDRSTWCMWPRPNLDLDAAVPVHLYGAVAPARNGQGFVTVEDASQAVGACDSEGDRVGSLGTAAAFSLYASKIVAAGGEGGVVTTRHAGVASRARLYRGQCATTRGAYWHENVGFNYRMTELSAAVALAQLETYDEHADRRFLLMVEYRHRLGSVVEFQRCDNDARNRTRSANWVAAVLVPEGYNPALLAAGMADDGVETRPFFVPLPMLPPYAGAAGDFSVARSLYSRGICLPLHSGMTTDDVARVCASFVSNLPAAVPGVAV